MLIHDTAHSTTVFIPDGCGRSAHARIDGDRIKPEKGDINGPVGCVLDDARTLTVTVATGSAHTIVVSDSYKNGQKTRWSISVTHNNL